MTRERAPTLEFGTFDKDLLGRTAERLVASPLPKSLLLRNVNNIVSQATQYG